MAENVATTLEIKENQLQFLEEMAKKHNLPDRSKALRCLITYAMQEKGQEAAIFDDVRCADC